MPALLVIVLRNGACEACLVLKPALVQVGNTKTPAKWSWPNVTFISVDEQWQLGYEIVKHLPTGNYARKMVGYLYAIAGGAQVIYETDDDNEPLPGVLTALQCIYVCVAVCAGPRACHTTTRVLISWVPLTGMRRM